MAEKERNDDNTGKSEGKQGNGKRILLRTFGCQMNVRDAEVIAGLLKQAGCSLADGPEKADAVIFVTCSVRQHAEEKVWSEIGRIAKQNKGQSPVRSESDPPRAGTVPIIGLVGCMAQNYKEQAFERSPHVDFVVGPGDIAKIPGILERLTANRSTLYAQKVWETDGETRPEEIYHTGFYEDKEHAYVVISEGCSNFCSYCIVPFVRGPLRNRRHEDILAEIREATAEGITKVTLLGQNVNAYTSPVSSHTSHVGFVDLLRLVNEIDGLKEFSFITSHPRDTASELFKAMAECEKIKKYLHLPVQSGSDRILTAMNRGYTRKFYLDLADNYRRIVPGGVLTTDIIVGFPGETARDFKDTFELVNRIEFDAAFIFKYSPRPHTEALKRPDDVPKEEKTPCRGASITEKDLKKETCRNVN